ncbi:MAG: hypothetical protein PWR10_1533 [Halanaerobiales bacterium]|nr:hypothetical protein [Halanaerobiales bacterium]
MIDYIAPYYVIEVGSKIIQKINMLEVVSSRINPVDIAELEIPIINHDFQAGQEIIIKQGYRKKGLWQLFRGFIINTSTKNTVKLFCEDYMTKLKDTKINKTFINCTPQEVLKYSLAKAGMKYTLTSINFRKKHHFIVKSKDVITLVKLINQTWEVDYDFYFDDDVFYWGPWEDSPRYMGSEIVKFKYGKNVIDLAPNDDGSGILKTISMPFIRHSNIIKIVDKNNREIISKVDRITTTLKDDKGRCQIEWQELKN